MCEILILLVFNNRKPCNKPFRSIHHGYGKNHWGTTGFRGWISGVGEVHQKLRFFICELVFILAPGGHLGFGPFFGDPWRTTGTPLTDPLEEQPFHHRMTCPGCPPPLQNTNNYKTQTSNIRSTVWKIFVVILRIVRNTEITRHIQQLCGRIPRAYTCTHTLRCTSQTINKHTHQAKKSKIRRHPKNAFFYSISGYGKFWPSKG